MTDKIKEFGHQIETHTREMEPEAESKQARQQV